mgnify:CR=1 FL=1
MLILDPAQFTIATSSDNVIFSLKGTATLSRTLTEKMLEKNLFEIDKPIHIGIGIDDKKCQICLIFDKKYKQTARFNSKKQAIQFNNIGFARHLLKALNLQEKAKDKEILSYRFDYVEIDNEKQVILKYGSLKVK